jgi:hypothetical protein
MKPIDYIYKNLGHLNMAVLEQLITDAGETVSEEIYNYLKETPWNTNMAILKDMGLDIERSSGEKKDSIPPQTYTLSITYEDRGDSDDYWAIGDITTPVDTSVYVNTTEYLYRIVGVNGNEKTGSAWFTDNKFESSTEVEDIIDFNSNPPHFTFPLGYDNNFFGDSVTITIS